MSKRRHRIVYPPDGTPISVEQQSSFLFQRAAPLQPVTIHLTVRLLVPQPLFPSLHFSSVDWPPDLEDYPLPWKVRDELRTAIKGSISRGMAAIAYAVPPQGLHVDIPRLEFIPPLEGTATALEIGRIRDLLARLITGAVTSLWGGLVALWRDTRDVEPPVLGKEWYVVQTDANGTGISGPGYQSRAAAEAAMTAEQRREGYQVVEARDTLAVDEAARGLPEPPELRHGEDALTPAQASAVRLGDKVYHIGREQLTRVNMIVSDAPGGPYFLTRHGLEVYSLFRLPEEGD